MRCPRCGTPAIDKGEPLEPNSWYEPFCPSCEKPLTREGLLIEIEGHSPDGLVKEIGKGGQVIWEYSRERGERCLPTREDAIQLLLKLSELEEQAKSLGKTADIKEAHEIIWNRKAAARRFRRWFDHEYGKKPLAIEDKRLRELADRILKPDEGREPDYEQIYKDMIEEGKFLDEIYGYEERKLREEPIVLTELPPETRAILEEAQEAYRWGLDRSVFAVCRALLEDVVRRVVLTHRLGETAIPINQENLVILLNCLPDHLLNRSDRDLAHRIRKAGNHALHELDNSFKEEPMEVLSGTAALVKRLLQQ
jgi:hypothetical protein